MYKKQLQSLLGSLLYISKCVRYSRFFLNRLLQILRDQSREKIIKLDHAFQKDVRWFKNFLVQFNGTSLYVKDKVDANIHLDACLTGVGAIFQNEIYQAKIPEKFKHCHIAALEMLNILVALRIWAKKWSGLAIKIFCDNEAVVSVLSTGKTRDPDLATISRNIYMLCAKFDILIIPQHVEGKSNIIADLLSRWCGSKNDLEKLKSLIRNPIWVNVSQEQFDLDLEI